MGRPCNLAVWLLAALLLAAAAGRAAANFVVIDGKTYRLGFFNRAYNDNLVLLSTQPWFTNSSAVTTSDNSTRLASMFAAAAIQVNPGIAGYSFAYGRTDTGLVTFAQPDGSGAVKLETRDPAVSAMYVFTYPYAAGTFSAPTGAAAKMPFTLNVSAAGSTCVATPARPCNLVWSIRPSRTGKHLGTFTTIGTVQVYNASQIDTVSQLTVQAGVGGLTRADLNNGVQSVSVRLVVEDYYGVTYIASPGAFTITRSLLAVANTLSQSTFSGGESVVVSANTNASTCPPSESCSFSWELYCQDASGAQVTSMTRSGENATFTTGGNGTDVNVFQSGIAMPISCDATLSTSYVANDTTTSTALASLAQTFTVVLPACSGASLPVAPSNVIVPSSCNTTGATAGDVCIATCPTGFNGSASISCNAGGWGSWSGGCADQRCLTSQLPRVPTNATLPTGRCNLTMPGASCTASCPAGYFGTPTIGCNSNGRGWAMDWTGICIETSTCQRAIPNCMACRFAFFRGTTTRAICTRCANNYVVAESGRACWCAPGFAWNSSTSTCARCGVGSWCSGARSVAISATRNACPAGTTTSTDVAMSTRDCWLLPGQGLLAGVTAACPIGTYNQGLNTRPCTRCPGGLTTASTGASSKAQCVAPAGSGLERDKAVPCAQGFYKPSVGNTDCIRCPSGWTTAFNTTGATNDTACRFVIPGFAAPANLTIGAAALALARCPINTYRAGTTSYNATTGLPCTPCGAALRTLPGSEGATSRDACLVAPGSGVNPATGIAAECPVGSYGLGWNRNPCLPCDAAGGSITTLRNASESVDDCVLPPGHGATRVRSGAGLTGGLTGATCPPDTFGRINQTFGIQEITCDKCMENTWTRNTSGATSVLQCVTKPGWGFEDGLVVLCEPGTWAAGNNHASCASCGGEGWTTLANASNPSATEAASGATSAAQCAPDVGYEYQNASNPSEGLRPCVQGTYKSLIGSSACTMCPAGTTTTKVVGSTSVADCNACLPGYGSNTTTNDLAAPSCTPCTDGTFSLGRVTGGNNCTSCPKPQFYNGRMVSRTGTRTADGCAPEFVTDADRPSHLYYDIIPMAPDSLTVQPNITALDGCQAACTGNARCTYFVHYGYNATGATEASQCLHRLQAAAVTAIAGFDPENATLAILFEVREDLYTVYPAFNADDAFAAGVTLATGLNWEAARSTCRSMSPCVGMSVSTTANSWRLFSGMRWEGAVGKVRVVGAALNSWVPDGAR